MRRSHAGLGRTAANRRRHCGYVDYISTTLLSYCFDVQKRSGAGTATVPTTCGMKLTGRAVAMMAPFRSARRSAKAWAKTP